MSIFNRIVRKERAGEETLGNPLPTWEGAERRLNYFSILRNGKGFRTPKTNPRTDAQGKTRGERKRALRARLFPTEGASNV
jgi:hypothetical protein